MPKSVVCRAILAIVFISLLFCNTAYAEDFDVDPETGYRMDRYRAVVPASVPGGITVDTAFVHKAHQSGNMVFIDVLPPKGMGADPIEGFWLITEPRLSIPGTTWLPEVGRGFLEPAHEDFFRRNLQPKEPYRGDTKTFIGTLTAPTDGWRPKTQSPKSHRSILSTTPRQCYSRNRPIYSWLQAQVMRNGLDPSVSKTGLTGQPVSL